MAFQFPEFPYFYNQHSSDLTARSKFGCSGVFWPLFLKKLAVCKCTSQKNDAWDTDTQNMMELPFRKIKRNKHNILDSVAFRTDALVFFIYTNRCLCIFTYIHFYWQQRAPGKA